MTNQKCKDCQPTWQGWYKVIYYRGLNPLGSPCIEEMNVLANSISEADGIARECMEGGDTLVTISLYGTYAEYCEQEAKAEDWAEDDRAALLPPNWEYRKVSPGAYPRSGSQPGKGRVGKD